MRRLEIAERKIIRDALHRHKFHMEDTAKVLGIGRTSLWRKIQAYKIVVPKDGRYK